MKKTLLIIGSIATLIAIVIAGIGIYITNTPEYALKEMIEDVNAYGMEGLRPHLTAEAGETIDAVLSVTGNDFFKVITGFISQNEYAGILKSEIQEIQWGIEDVRRNQKNAAVILSFNYKDKLIGTIEISMVRENHEWKIDGLEFPKFEKINW